MLRCTLLHVSRVRGIALLAEEDQGGRPAVLPILQRTYAEAFIGSGLINVFLVALQIWLAAAQVVHVPVIASTLSRL